jgi:hypothetical protein
MVLVLMGLFVDLHDDDFYFRMIEMLPFFFKKKRNNKRNEKE